MSSLRVCLACSARTPGEAPRRARLPLLLLLLPLACSDSSSPADSVALDGPAAELAVADSAPPDRADLLLALLGR